jgi:hypothetical protein
MKTSARAVMILLVGLILAGCASKSAQSKPARTTSVASWGEQPMSARDYWMMRDLDYRLDRARAQP